MLARIPKKPAKVGKAGSGVVTSVRFDMHVRAALDKAAKENIDSKGHGRLAEGEGLSEMRDIAPEEFADLIAEAAAIKLSRIWSKSWVTASLCLVGLKPSKRSY